MNAINFTMGDSETISGYTNIDINTGLSSVINGSTKNILCECLDKIPIQARNTALQQITNKLAFDGEAIFKCLNATVLAERILKNELDRLAKAKAEAEAKAKAEAAKKKSTITCIKGKIIKKVTALNPKCPSGYKKK